MYDPYRRFVGNRDMTSIKPLNGLVYYRILNGIKPSLYFRLVQHFFLPRTRGAPCTRGPLALEYPCLMVATPLSLDSDPKQPCVGNERPLHRLWNFTAVGQAAFEKINSIFARFFCLFVTLVGQNIHHNIHF